MSTYVAIDEVAFGFNKHHSKILLDLASCSLELDDFSQKLKLFNDKLDNLHKVAASCISESSCYSWKLRLVMETSHYIILTTLHIRDLHINKIASICHDSREIPVDGHFFLRTLFSRCYTTD